MSSINFNTNTYNSMLSNTNTRTSNSDKNYITDANGNVFEVVSSKDNSHLSQDNFLNMLLLQMQLQDPLSPLDTNEQTAQLATFSILEQLTSISSKLDDLAKAIINNNTQSSTPNTDSSNNESSDNSNSTTETVNAVNDLVHNLYSSILDSSHLI